MTLDITVLGINNTICGTSKKIGCKLDLWIWIFFTQNTELSIMKFKCVHCGAEPNEVLHKPIKSSQDDLTNQYNNIMARFLSALTILASSMPGATAFCPSTPHARQSASLLRATEDTDFDAPIPANPASGTAVLDHEPIVDDECYMGKDGSATECVDFDPPYNPKRLSRSFNSMDGERATPRWAANFDDFDAPIPAYPSVGDTVLTSEPIVDDECYMGKDGSATDCVDFDPPRLTRSANAMDQGRNTPKWASNFDDFDAPIPAYPSVGNTVLDHEPIVDDECYMGKDGSATDCVDFDPPALRTYGTASESKATTGRSTRSANAMDQDRAPPSWLQSAFANIVKEDDL